MLNNNQLLNYCAFHYWNCNQKRSTCLTNLYLIEFKDVC
ncbi:hypothetical protein ECTW14313_1801 [Escherichia coli O157:H7 str. TW14313]|nr:hypothetical protein ECTW14313_1801 [Escherichia coli O157:H7 str. TW14313]EKH79562.1 hypothetical protein ECPA45_1989 [Escherichia coli PA45]EKI48266.1 hypothetical protein ECPA38_1846 [Escherichia coli PA38]ELW31143.1 hypothetical protein ECPA35_1846 [Escherichia coli PA35]